MRVRLTVNGVDRTVDDVWPGESVLFMLRERLGLPGSKNACEQGGRLHPVQQAFVEAGAVQCGFCTPGLVVAVADLVARNPAPTDAQTREALAGNLCRCTGYEKIIDAVHLAADRMSP